MDLPEAIKYVNCRFRYSADPKSNLTDYWSVMQTRYGAMEGDCDDYAITVLWRHAGGTFRFFRKLFSGEFQIHRVLTNQGDYHIVASVGGVWFDNWTRRGMSMSELFASTEHKYIKTYNFTQILWYLLCGIGRR